MDNASLPAYPWQSTMDYQSELRQMQLKHVLSYLTVNGPTPWSTLYVHFDYDKSGDILKGLMHLANCKYICVEGTTATITQLGIDQLNS